MYVLLEVQMIIFTCHSAYKEQCTVCTFPCIVFFVEPFDLHVKVDHLDLERAGISSPPVLLTYQDFYFP